MFDKILTKIASQTATNWFTVFCFVLPFIGLIYSPSMAFVGFLSSSFLQLALLPILSRGQDKHDEKLNAILALLQKEEEKELEELSEILDTLNK